MAEHDPKAFQDLFAAEPEQPSAEETAAWVDRYTRLVHLLERHLQETQSFSASVPAPISRYLERENVKILSEELEIFRRRLEHWSSLRSGIPLR